MPHAGLEIEIHILSDGTGVFPSLFTQNKISTTIVTNSGHLVQKAFVKYIR